MNRKIITRRAVQLDKHETEGHAMVLYDSKFSELQKKRKLSKLPITVDTQNSTVNLENRSQVDFHTSKPHSLVDSLNETSSSLPVSLSSLTLTNLRAMAKEHNVSKYYKLRKGALVEQLIQRLSSC
ncbi:DNA-dependent transcription, termination [Spatholobus suberectus]|nr:DNA-dependent transcription, termination [Spatholobus suberectus]